MVTHGLDDRVHAGVTDTETFARHAAHKYLTRCRAVQRHVADDHVFLGHKRGTFGRINNQFAAAQALAEIIIGIAFELQGHALGNERAQALTGTAVELQMDGVFRQPGGAVLLGDFTADNRADHAVHVDDRQFGRHFFAALNGGFADVQQLGHVQRLFQTVILRLLAETADFRSHVGTVENRGQIQTGGLPMFNRLPRNQFVGATDHFFQGAETELGHDLAQFRRDEFHEVDDMVGIAREPLAQFRVLCGHPHGTGVQMADAHHDATHDDERRRGKTEFLGAEQGGHCDVAAGFQLAVRFHINAAAEIVQHQRLVRLGQAKLPRSAGMFDGGQR